MSALSLLKTSRKSWYSFGIASSNDFFSDGSEMSVSASNEQINWVLLSKLSEIKSESESKFESKFEIESGAGIGTETKSGTGTETETGTETKSRTGAETKSGTGAETRPGTGAETETGTGTETDWIISLSD